MKLEEIYPEEYNILPCKITKLQNGKKKIIFVDEWKKYQNEKYPRHLLKNNNSDYFVITGKISGNLIVIDFDIKKDQGVDSEELYKNILEIEPRFKSALTIRTQSGGLHFHTEPESMDCYHSLEKNRDIPCIIDDIEHIDIQGEGKIALIYPSNFYEIINQAKPLKLSNLEFLEILNKFKKIGAVSAVDATKTADSTISDEYNNDLAVDISGQLTTAKIDFSQMSKEFQDILNGKIEIENYAKTYNKKEFIYWKFLFREAYHKSNLNPDHLKPILEENQPSFDWGKTTGQLIHHPYTEKPMTITKRKEFFPEYYIKKPKTQKYDAYEINDLILGLYHIKTLGMKKPEYCLYQGGVYKRNQIRSIETIISNTLRELGITYTLNKNNEILKLIANNTAVESIEEFDKNKSILNLENGLLNIETLELREHTPEYLSLRRIPVIYDSLATCPKISKFLHQIFYSKDIRYILQKIGLSLTSDITYQDGTFLFGTGNNGKTTFYNLLRILIGVSNSCGVDLYKLNGFEFSRIENKLANIVSDIDSSQKINIQNYKLYVGNEMVIQINRKFIEPYDIPPTAYMWYSCNTVFPQVPIDTDKGFWRKVTIIECPNEFDFNEDTKILEKIATPPELSGLLNLVLLNVRYLYNRGSFSKRYKDWGKYKDFWLTKNNLFSVFVEEETITDKQYYSNKQETLKRINIWLVGKGKTPITDKKLTQMIKGLPKFYNERVSIDKRQRWVYTGFTFKDDKKVLPKIYQQRFKQRIKKKVVNEGIGDLYDSIEGEGVDQALENALEKTKQEYEEKGEF